MRVLVTAATRHGSTDEIAMTIARVLGDLGLDATVIAPDRVESLEPYEAVVLGSGVYLGRWLEPARSFVEHHAADLAARRVWLFSSGPIGEPLSPDSEPLDVGPIRELIGARDHRDFAGRLERHELGLGERAIVAIVHAPDGDFRAWPEIETWAAGIAAELMGRAPSPGQGIPA